jgi:acetyl esterase/lipase
VKLLVAMCCAFSLCVLIPAPLFVLLPFTIAATELAHWLVAFHLLVLLLVWRSRRRWLPLVALSTAICALPLTQYRFPPPAAPLAARLAVVDIYGGAWQRGSPSDDAAFDRFLASRGYAVYGIDYRHAPAARFPAQLEDVRAAIERVWSKAGGRRLVLCGRSSGAELALLAGYKWPDGIAGVISFYGPTDLTAGYADVPFPDPIDERAVLRTYLGGTPQQLPDAYREASPVSYMRPGLPPTLLIHGLRDHIVKPRFSRDLQKALIGAGNRVELLELPWSEHAFDLVPGGIGRRRAWDAVADFLGRL